MLGLQPAIAHGNLVSFVPVGRLLTQVLATDSSAVRRLLDALPLPAILLDRTRAIVLVNASAAPCLQTVSCLAISGNRVCRFAGQCSEAFDVVFERALAGRSSEVAVTVNQAARRSLWRINVAPFERESDSARAAQQTAVLLLLEPPLTSQTALPLLTRLFGLTAAEARVLALLLEDRRPKEIARDLDVTVATVRSHLKSLFLKTGTRCQSELVSLALSAA